MLGSLTLYRRLLFEHVYTNPRIRNMIPFANREIPDRLPSFGHGIAGIMAGSTVSFIAAPVEHIKARLQIQYAADKSQRLYRGPIDCTRKIVRSPPTFSPYIYSPIRSPRLMLSFFFSCAHMVSKASITASLRRYYSAHFSSSGGDHMISSPAYSNRTPTCPPPPSISGPEDSLRRYSG